MTKENINDYIEELADDKKICLLVGYITNKALNVDSDYSAILQNKVIKNVNVFSYNILKNIYVQSVKVLTDHDAIVDELNSVVELTSLLMIQNDNNITLTKDEVSYYYTLGLTIQELSFNDKRA